MKEMHIEPFVDNYIIEDLGSASLKLNNPSKKEKVLTFKSPWAHKGSLVMSALQSNGKVYLYYRGFPEQEHESDEDEKQCSCLAVSTDGINFENAEVNKINYDGITQNNIVFMGISAHNFTPFYDTNPSCPENERYKATGGLLTNGGMHLYHSPDGILWEEYGNTAVITDGDFDSMNTAFYDANSQIYRCYSRYFDRRSGSGIRAIQSTASKDFFNWTPQVHNSYIAEDYPTEHFYTNSTRCIPGAEHILVSYPMRFAEKRKKVASHDFEGVSDAVFITSRNGTTWDRTFREAWIYPDTEVENWTERSFISACGIVEINDEFNFYVTEHYRWADSGIVRYSIPRMRFASIYGGWQGAEVIIKPFVSASGKLIINYNTSALGSISIALIDSDGNAIEGAGYAECGEIYGNELDCEVKWNGKALSEFVKSGSALKLAVKLVDANLYSIAY